MFSLFPIGYPSPSTQRNFSTETGRAGYIENTCAERWDRCLVASSSVSSRYVYSASLVGERQSLSISLAMLKDDLHSYCITRYVSAIHAVALPTTDLFDDPFKQWCSWTICTRARTNSSSAVFFITVEPSFLADLGESPATTDENQSIRETIHQYDRYDYGWQFGWTRSTIGLYCSAGEYGFRSIQQWRINW